MTCLSAFLLGVMCGVAAPFVYFYFDWKAAARRRRNEPWF